MSAPTKGYIGHGVSSLDSRGRFTLPVAYRAQVHATSDEAGQFQIRASESQPCLFGFGDQFIRQISAELTEKSAASAGSLALSFDNPIFFSFLSEISSVTLDSGGRFHLPPVLRDHAGITDKLFIVGGLYQFQLWQPERFLEVGNPGVIAAAACRALIEGKARGDGA